MENTSHLTEKAFRDYQLVKRAVDDGDQKAYAELMKNYRDSLYYMLLKMTNNAVDADDLTIEAFGKAFKNLHQYTPNYAFSTWLQTTVSILFVKRRKIHFRSIRILTVTREAIYRAAYPVNHSIRRRHLSRSKKLS